MLRSNYHGCIQNGPQTNTTIGSHVQYQSNNLQSPQSLTLQQQHHVTWWAPQSQDIGRLVLIPESIVQCTQPKASSKHRSFADASERDARPP